MSGSGCYGDHLPGSAVSASPEQFRHQEILSVLCSWGQASCLTGTLLSRELSQPWGWGVGSIKSPIMLPLWTLLSSLTPGGPFPPAQPLMVTCEGSFQGQGTAEMPRATPSWSSLEKEALWIPGL